MQTPEQKKQTEDFNQKLSDLVNNEMPEGHQLIFISASVEVDEEDQDGFHINATAGLIGNGKKLIAATASVFEKEPKMRSIMNRALLDANPLAGIFENLCKRF